MDAAKTDDYDADHVEHGLKIPKVETVHHPDPKLYIEALERYPNDDSIDQAAERRLIRKLDIRILPLLGICYFFYVGTLYLTCTWHEQQQETDWQRLTVCG
jgi:hypothetical protein